MGGPFSDSRPIPVAQLPLYGGMYKRLRKAAPASETESVSKAILCFENCFRVLDELCSGGMFLKLVPWEVEGELPRVDAIRLASIRQHDRTVLRPHRRRHQASHK